MEVIKTIPRTGCTECAMHVTPDGRKIAFAEVNTARVIDSEKQMKIWEVEHPAELTSVNFSPLEDRIVTTSCKDMACTMWDTRAPHESSAVRIFRETGEALWAIFVL